MSEVGKRPEPRPLDWAPYDPAMRETREMLVQAIARWRADQILKKVGVTVTVSPDEKGGDKE